MHPATLLGEWDTLDTMTAGLIGKAAQVVSGDGEGEPLMAGARVRLSVRAALSTKFDGKATIGDGQFSNELAGIGATFSGTDFEGACLTHNRFSCGSFSHEPENSPA